MNRLEKKLNKKCLPYDGSVVNVVNFENFVRLIIKDELEKVKSVSENE